MKKAKPEDVSKIISLLRGSFSYSWKKTNRKFHKNFVEKSILEGIKKDIAIVEEDKGKIICFGWAKKDFDFFGNKFGHIKLIVVSTEHQNKGLGKKVLKELEKRLKTKDIRFACLEINGAKKIFVNWGYAPFLTTFRKKELN